MKKMLSAVCALLLTLSLVSCVEHIGEENVKPGLGPIEGVESPTNPAPAPHVNTADIPEEDISEAPTEGEDVTDPEENTPTDEDIVLNNGATGDKAKSTAVSGWPKNDVFSGKGDKVDKSTSGTTTVYRVKYAETLTMIVEVTPAGENVKVDVYLEHYRLAMGADKPITVTIGDHSSTALTAELEWESNTPAKTLLMSATASADGAQSVKVGVDMVYGGKYHGEEIENFSFEETVELK